MTPEERYREDLVQQAEIDEYFRKKHERKMKVKYSRREAVTDFNIFIQSLKKHIKILVKS